MTRLEEYYKKEVIPKIMKEFNLSNSFEVPRVKKIVINVGIGQSLKEKKLLDYIINTVTRISGQAPIKTYSKKAISGFGIREGQAVGLKVTLRGDRMYQFLDKLINVSLPRVRDFRGLSAKSFDDNGNYSIGLKEQIVFPEIRADEVDYIHGLEITINTSAKDKGSAHRLLKLLGFPFKEK